MLIATCVVSRAKAALGFTACEQQFPSFFPSPLLFPTPPSFFLLDEECCRNRTDESVNAQARPMGG